MEEVLLNPSLDKLSDCKVIGAIDLGTTYSGHAYATKSQSKEVVVKTTWGAEFGLHTSKTPTSVLTDGDSNFLAFGYLAKRLYSSKKDNHLYDECFKMRLYKEKYLKNNIPIQSKNGAQTIPLLMLMKMSIKFLYEDLVQDIKRGLDGIEKSDVGIVLTVPAIWDDFAKSFMREAATLAGIESERLVLALEPEAASLYCRTLNPKEMTSNGQSEKLDLPKSTRYIALDCGGGTVDITVHEVIDSTSVKEIYCANGGAWGGSNVNNKFEQKLKQIFGTNFIDQFKIKKPTGWFEIEQDFELNKRINHSDSSHLTDTTVSIKIPNSLIKEYEALPGSKTIACDINSRSLHGCTYNDDDARLDLSLDVFKNMFESSVDQILSHIMKIWENSDVAQSEYIFMVGGFSDCVYLFDRVCEMFETINSKVKVLRPTMAGAAVLKGAVIFGHSPTAIKSRTCCRTYGQKIMVPFNSKQHDSMKKINVDGLFMCKDIFSVWAKKNEEIQVGERRIFTTVPAYKSAKRIESAIYAADEDDVMYTTDPGVDKLASLQIDVPDNHLPQKKREIKYYVYFGGTELHVRVQDHARPNGDSNEAVITFE